MGPTFTKLIIALLVSSFFCLCHGGCSMNWLSLTPKVPPETASGEDEFAKRRQWMVREQLQGRDITDERVLAAMLKVPRHEFVPSELRDAAYQDNAQPLASGQTISQPYIVAYMTQALQLHGTERVLEIGTGSGYQAAVLAEIVPEVYTIEILPELQKQAGAVLAKLEYKNIRFRVGDGYLGWPEYAPFDRIIVTAAPDEIPQPLIDQLKEGGRLIIPVGSISQELVVLEKGKTGITRRATIGVRFVPMTGKAQQTR